MTIAIRTSPELVGTIVEVDDSVPLDSAIQTAALLVTRCCTGALGPDPAYSSDELEMIERYAAAHFYSINVQRVASETAGPVQASYQYKVDLGLAVTTYGQQAMLLDFNGGLAQANANALKGKRKAKMVWLGKDESDCP